MDSKRSKMLTCGCCGQYFDTWEGYIDQDQDVGYGICKSCQEWISDREAQEADKAIALLAGALNEKNRAKFLGFSRSKQLLLVAKAFEDGILSWTIGGR